MGLDTDYDAWNGPYSSFGRWRAVVAKAAGHTLVRTTEGRDDYWNAGFDALAEREPGCYEGAWVELPADVLNVLLMHSDCDGIIPAGACAPLANRLEELVPKLEQLYPADEIDWLRSKTEKFIAGLREAAADGEDIEFY